MHVVLSIVAMLVAVTPVATSQRLFGPGVCGPVDPVYVRNATATGGQPFPVSAAEMDKLAVVMAESARSDATMILWASGASADEGGFSVPIDSSVKRVTFSTTFDGKGAASGLRRRKAR